ncbi:anti-phage ZorAB system protein ZorA [Methylocaldum sp.]|uniref:anti-phage ZorAB system protein ZorA n=1 Tax=Methylocaldum sp. TaxID=1969727 RepID=UPI002D69BA3B|nr:anti-phage ZorAB system protein ZorA [Methylocaldum sp.]HYE36944.1 anti-phage ZorAB system protein ZorA [Methylocaldum sp.]
MESDSSNSITAVLLPIFDFFKHPEVAVGIAGGMLVIALLILLWFVIKHMVPMLSTLRRVKKQLRATPDHDAFNNDFARIDEVITQERLLKHGWEEFKETLILPRLGEPGAIRNTVRPSTYLNVGSVSSELNLSFYQAVPNYFVGIGLLFTFLGLVAAIYFASEGVAGDVKQAKDSLGNLLTAATFKFATSIAGLGSSILLSLFVKLLSLRVQLYFDRLCELLEQRMTSVTPEWLAFQQVDELKKQTIQLERFNTDFAVEVAKALELRLNDSLGAVIGKAVEPMVTAIDGMAKNFGEVNQDAMHQMVGEFKSSLQGTTGAEMTALAQTLATLQETLGTMISGLGQSGGSFSDRIEKAAERLENLIGGAARSMETSVAESASRLEKILAGASQSLRTDAELVSSELGAAIAQIAKQFQGGLADAASQWKGELSASAEGIRGAVDRAGNILATRVDAATQRFGEVVTPFATQIKGLESTLHALDGRLTAQLDGFDGSIIRLREVMAEIDQSLIQLREAGTPIAQTADRFGRAAQQIEATSQAVKQAHDQLTEVAKTIRDGAQSVQQSWESYRQRFEKVDEDLSAAFGRIQQGTDAYHGRVIEYVEKMDGHFAKSLTLLSGGITELKETVEELTEALTN